MTDNTTDTAKEEDPAKIIAEQAVKKQNKEGIKDTDAVVDNMTEKTVVVESIADVTAAQTIEENLAEVVVEQAATTEAEEIIDDTIIAPGSLTRALKKCREGSGMDVGQAAEEMRLPLAVIKALEAENFTDLPEPPYIRGYLRSYSRLNDSDPNDLIRRYEVLRGADPDDIASFSPSMPLNRVTNKPTVSPNTVKLAGLALTVVLLGVLSMIPAVSQWATDTWQSFSKKTDSTEVQTAQQTGSKMASDSSTDSSASSNNTATNSMASSSNDTAANSDNTEQLALNNQGTESSEAAPSEADKPATNDNDSTAIATDNAEKAPDTDAANNTTASTDDQKTETAGADATDTNASKVAKTTTDAESKQKADALAKEAEAAAAKKAEEAAAAEKLAEQKRKEEAEIAAQLAKEKAAKEAKKLAAAAAAKQVQQNQQQPSGDNFQQPIDGTVAIRLDFTESVWMSIKNGKGKSIFAALNEPGTRKELKARTPLAFKVGNAPGVKIYLNGQLIDQTPYSRGSVSTFSVK